MVTLRAVTFCRNEGATVATGVTGGSPSGSVPVSSPVGVSVGSGVNVKVGGHYQLWALA